MVIVGRLFGSAGLGSYGLASIIANVPLERIVSVVGQVTPSVFAVVQHDIAELRRYFLRICAVISLLMFPLSTGLVLVADLFVVAALGEKWNAAILPMQLLAASTIPRALGIFANQLILAHGRSDIYARWSFLGLIALPPLFYLGSYLGIPGVAAAWLVGYPCAVGGPVMRSATKLSRISIVTLWRCMLPAVRATVVMTISVLIVRHFTGSILPPSGRLVLSVIVGALSYLGTLVLVDRDLLPRLCVEVWRLRSGTRGA
jgi:O-antigen/teichoic acid export membrane protein